MDRWRLVCRDAGGVDLNCTWGGFLPPQGVDLPVHPVADAGSGVAFSLSLTEEDGTPLENTSFRITPESPLFTRAEVLAQYADMLKDAVLDVRLMESGMDDDTARLLTLEGQLGKRRQQGGRLADPATCRYKIRHPPGA
jgi:hypothetical protein